MPHELRALPRFITEPDPEAYWSDNYVVLDFETTTHNKGSPLDPRNRIVLACWEQHLSMAGGKRRVNRKECRANEYGMGELVRDIADADFIVAHNSKFELGWLHRCGVDLHDVLVYDTMIGEYVRGGNRYNLVMLGLDATLKRYGLAPKRDLCGFMLKLGLPTEDFPESWLLDYCHQDVRQTGRLFRLQREILKKRNLIHIQYQRCLVTPALTAIELNGMQLDYAMVKEQIREQEDLYAKKTAEFQAFMGGRPPASTKQKGEFVYDVLNFTVPRDPKGKPYVTKAGKGSVAADVLAKLKAKTNRQREFLRHNKEWALLHSDVTKYLRKFELCCKEAGGHLQATFNQCVSNTHRLTSSGYEYKVQFQNLNRKFKPIFKSRNKDWLMGEADGAQLEFRIATHLGRDPQGFYDITTGVDVHKYTASVILDIPEEEVTREQRQEAKADTFKPTYGGRSGTPAQQKYYDAFSKKYSALHATQTKWTHQVLENKKLETEYGMVYYWPDCKMTQYGYITHTTNIFNYPVQGFATAEIIPIALVCAWHRMRDMESFLVNTVHDSIIAELHPEEVDMWHEVAKQCLIVDCYDILETLYKVDLTVPLGAGVMVGTHWANKEAKDNETVYEADPDLYLEAAHEGGMT